MSTIEQIQMSPKNKQSYQAVGIAEGWIQTNTEEEYIQAWQTLIDNGLCWKLQGWFGRNAQTLINEGYCTEHNNET